MDAKSRALVQELKNAGLSDEAIRAAWPSWWTDEAASSSSARAELRFALSRHLGLQPESLLGERVEFVWQDQARFKNLTAGDQIARGALASFGVALGQLLLRATPEVRKLGGLSAIELRKSLLSRYQFVDLTSLLTLCWGIGVPVIHLRIFPLRAKRMRAMVVELNGRHAILLGRDERYPAPAAFTLAHEIGHAALGHASSGRAIVDVGDPFEGEDDQEEKQADEFGLALLTGAARPTITMDSKEFGPRTLANACINAGPEQRIEPGTLALCVGYLREDWGTASGALRHIYAQPAPVWEYVNRVAASQLDWSSLSDDSARYLRSVMSTDD